jgi:hypothetical protein
MENRTRLTVPHEFESAATQHSNNRENLPRGARLQQRQSFDRMATYMARLRHLCGKFRAVAVRILLQPGVQTIQAVRTN